jgi:hypothetical protein
MLRSLYRDLKYENQRYLKLRNPNRVHETEIVQRPERNSLEGNLQFELIDWNEVVNL